MGLNGEDQVGYFSFHGPYIFFYFVGCICLPGNSYGQNREKI